jgi:penicillin-binding protein 2B
MKIKRSRVRVNNLLILVFFCCFLLAIGKLIFVAVSSNIDGKDLTAFANKRDTKKRVIPATRGNIYDVNKETIASNANSYTLIAYLSEKRTTNVDNPQHVIDKERTAKSLAEVLEMDYDYVLGRLNVKGAYQVEFGTKGKNLSENQKVKIESLGLPGIGFIAGNKRYYKNNKIAPYIVGYAKTSEDGEINGEIGIERQYDNVLKGEDGYSEYQVDGAGYQMGEPLVNKDPISGSDIYLTIDTGIQLILEDALHTLEENNTFDWFTMTVIDANTGAIVASTSSPSFNPNDVSTIKNYVNPLIGYTYEPGSTMKIYSWLAAMESGIYDGAKEYQSGTTKVDNYTIKDFNNVGWGMISYDKGFAYSSNVAATNLALELGNIKLKEFYESLGFGSKTGIELPYEEKGILKMTYKSELATASFGQGITTTPIQNLQALTIFTNDGEMLKPYIVDKIVDQEGKVTYQGERTSLGQKASSENVKKMRELMYDVVYNGVSNYYQPNNVTLAGKTGTAEFTGSNGKYLSGSLNRIRSFAGFFPYENPKYIFYVSVKKLDGENKALANAVVKAVESIANYSNITNTTSEIDKDSLISLKNYISQNVKETKENLENEKLKVYVIGDGKAIINQYPLKGSEVIKGSKVFLLTENEEYIMPDITGWSSSEVMNFCNLIGLNYKFNGYGIVKEFNIDKDTIIDLTKTLEVTLST